MIPLFWYAYACTPKVRVTWNGALGKWDATGEPLMGCSFMIRRALVWMEGVVPLDSHGILINKHEEREKHKRIPPRPQGK